MMHIHIRLYGILREKLPPEANGRSVLTIPEHSTITAVLNELSLHRHIQVAINDEIEDNLDTLLQDGDRLDIFRPSAGGM